MVENKPKYNATHAGEKDKKRVGNVIRNPPSGSLAAMSLPGIIISIGIAYMLYQNRSATNEGKLSSNGAKQTPLSRKLFIPHANSWEDGYYTTESIPNQTGPSTHARLYDNGGMGTAELVSFSSEEEFLSLGRLYNDLGQIVQSSWHFLNGTELYRGPSKPGTHFHWPAVHVGYKRPVPGMVGGTGKQIEIETLTEPSSTASTSDPRVFYVHNFLSEDEADEFIRFSTSDENQYKMAHSTGGTHKAWNQGGDGARLTTRTSMNAFDITTELSFRVKKRAFRLLRMGSYQESLADGIQILRYELGQAYVAHHDYFPTRQSDDHSWNPAEGGSNRMATVFLYLSDVDFGGETVFPASERLTAEKSKDLVARLGEPPSNDLLMELKKEARLNEGSWEDRLTTQCYTKFAVPPRRGDAILFYSQRPDGKLDTNSIHGACPVLKGMKWGANLWVWNACRYSQCTTDPLHPSEELPEKLKAPFEGGI